VLRWTLARSGCTHTALFALAPFVATAAAAAIPISDAMYGLSVSLGLVVAGLAGRRWANNVVVAEKLGCNAKKIEDFYRDNEVLPLRRYVLFPIYLLFWFRNPRARTELGLFRGLGLLSIVVLVAAAGREYISEWLPDIAFEEFASSTLATFIVETWVLLVLLVPMTAIVARLRAGGEWRRAKTLLVVAGVSLAIGSGLLIADDEVSVVTKERIALRNRARPDLAATLQAQALTEARASLAAGRSKEVAGERGRALLRQLFKSDEAKAFRFDALHGVLVYYVIGGTRGDKTLWFAETAGGVPLRDLQALPEIVRRELAGERP